MRVQYTGTTGSINMLVEDQNINFVRYEPKEVSPKIAAVVLANPEFEVVPDKKDVTKHERKED
jgi:hypothetical protein